MRKAICDGVLTIIQDRELRRDTLALFLFLSAGIGALVTGTPKGADSAIFMATLAALIVFRALRDVVRGALESATLLLPISAACISLIITGTVGVPAIAMFEDRPEAVVLATALVASSATIVSYMLLDGIFGHRVTRENQSAQVAIARRDVDEDDQFSHLDGVQYGWGVEAEQHPHRYWVTYTFRHSMGEGNGASSLARTQPITCHYDVMSIAELLRAELRTQNPHLTGIRVSIKSWQRFEHPEKPPGSTEDIPIEALPKNVIAISRGKAA